MGWWISLMEDGEPVKVDRHMEGGVVCMGGSTKADISITWNYSSWYYQTIDSEVGIRWLYGKKGEQTIARLKEAVETLGTERDDNYWNGTAGNAGHALSVLLKWAIQHPQAVWEGD